MEGSKIQDFLEETKAQGKASPDGMHWNDFFHFLKQHKKTGETDPPVPLILAASGESPASKHRRLEEQLEWARENKCLEQAIDFLRRLDDEMWVISPASRWNTSSYWSPD